MTVSAIYTVNEKALNNGKPTVYSESLIIRNINLQEITLDAILTNIASAQGCKVHIETEYNKLDPSCSPQGAIKIIEDDVFVVGDKYNYHLNPMLDYSAISDTKRIAEIEKEILDATYITSCHTIVKGEWTALYAKPNHGMALTTLATMTQQISNGIIDGKDVFYTNHGEAKPSYIENLKVMRRFDINVFDKSPVAIIKNLIDHRQAKDKVFIIDGLNNSYNFMQFSKLFKKFCELGGTVITLIDAKKYVHNNGSPIIEELEAVLDHADCVYSLQSFDDIIQMKNIKKRANVIAEVTFQVGQSLPYPDLFNSVRTLTDKQALEFYSERRHAQLAIDHKVVIETIKEAILNGVYRRTALLNEVRDNTGEYKHIICRVLDELEGKQWKMTPGSRNSKVYSII